MKNNKIYLDYDPKYQGIVRIAAYLFFASFAIFIVQVVLLITNIELFINVRTGDWDNFLRGIAASPNQFILIKVNFIALRVCYILMFLGYIIAVWKLNRSASLSFLGFALVSLPVIMVSQVFQISLLPLAQDYMNTLAASGITQATDSAYLLIAKIIYTATDYGDAFVNLVLFNGLLISWAIIARNKPHPRFFFWWLITLAVLPIGRFIGLEFLGLINAVLTAIFLLIMGIFMLRFEPAKND